MKLMQLLLMVFLLFGTACEIMPRNTLKDCLQQCKDSKNPKACQQFCDCIHKEGKPLNQCLDVYEKAKEDSVQIK